MNLYGNFSFPFNNGYKCDITKPSKVWELDMEKTTYLYSEDPEEYSKLGKVAAGLCRYACHNYTAMMRTGKEGCC